MHLSRPITAVLAGATLAVVLAGCAQGASNDGEGGGDGATGTLTYWSMWEADEPQAEILKTAIADFTEETGIEVDVEWQGRSVLTKVAPTIRGGGAPDLVDQDSNQLYATLADAYVDLADVYEAEIPGEDLTVGEPGVEDVAPTDPQGDGQYAVPYEVLGYGIHYNGATLPDVAASPPETFEDFVAVLDELKASGRQPLALDASVGFYQSLWTVTALQNVLGVDGFTELVEDETGGKWSDPGTMEALEQIEALGAGGYFVDGSFGSKFPAIQEKWAAGESDFIMNGTWLPSEVKNSVTGEWEWHQLPWPGDGDQGTVLTATIGFSVPATAENPDAAKEFIAHFLKKEYQEALVADTNNLVPRTDIEPPAVLADFRQAMSDGDAQPVMGDVKKLYPTYAAEVFEPLNLELLKGSLTAADFAERIADAQSKYWATQG